MAQPQNATEAEPEALVAQADIKVLSQQHSKPCCKSLCAAWVIHIFLSLDMTGTEASWGGVEDVKLKLGEN